MKSFTAKKLICLFAVIVICGGMLLLASCNKDEGEPTPPPANDEEQTPTAEGFPISKDDVTANVIYPVAYEEELSSKARDLASSIKKYSGMESKVSNDYLKKGQTSYDETTIEILLGYTSYPQSKDTYEKLADYGECKIQIVGNKVVVASWDLEALDEGIKELKKALKEGTDENKNIFLPSDYAVSLYDKGTVGMAKLPVYSAKKPTVIDQGDGCYQYVFSQATSDDFASYAALLEASGYTLYTENTIAGKTADKPNRFKTYVNDKCVVNLSIMPGMGRMFVIADDLTKTALPGLEADNSYDKTVKLDTLFTQVGLYSHTPDNPDLSTYGNKKPPSFAEFGSSDTNGQSNVIRLSDGSFIIIDGGHGNDGDEADYKNDAVNLYKILQKQAPDKDNIVIAAWIFTHAHDDHVMTFPDFMKAYGTQVKIEKLIMNMPSEKMAYEGGGDCRVHITPYLSSAALKDTDIIKAHVGQKFFIRNATIQILCNFEMLQPYNLQKGDNSYNNTSLVFSVEMEDVKFMILGDCYDQQNMVIPWCYGTEALKSDVVQVAHHGIGGTNEDVYSLIDADYAIWPAGNYYYDFPAWGDKFNYIELTKHSYNKWFADPENIDPNNIYWALDDVDVITVKSGAISVTSQSFADYLGA